MKTKLIIVGFVLAFIAYFIFINKPESNKVTENISIENIPTNNAFNESEKVVLTNEIEYTDNGFSPIEITIKKGQTITFINKSSKLMWVASDDHPTHRLYPEFDAKKGFSNQENFTFTFDKIGQWDYHNHLRATDTGSIIVVE